MALPILVPLFFIIYTDVLALALLVWATLATLKGRHGLSALSLTMLICVRQHEVLWAGFLLTLAVWPAWRTGGIADWRAIVVRGLPYLFPIGGFLGFWAWNGSISMSSGQSALHPDLSLHTGNPYFALFLACILLPLQVLAGLREFAAHARQRPWLLAIPLLIFAGFWWTFHADNPYNSAVPQYYIRNGFLQVVDTDPLVRALTGMAATAAACGLAFTRLQPGYARWLYPFAAVFLAASWLIEQRYVLVPLALWLAFREHRGRAVEGATFALWLLLAVYGFHGMVGGRFFL
jgi:alpha-1,2-glucosyltransferase